MMYALLLDLSFRVIVSLSWRRWVIVRDLPVSLEPWDINFDVRMTVYCVVSPSHLRPFMMAVGRVSFLPSLKFVRQSIYELSVDASIHFDEWMPVIKPTANQ